MEVQFMLMFSRQVKKELLSKRSLLEVDQETVQLKNQEQVRKNSCFSETIDAFLKEKSSYIHKIQDVTQKHGRLTLMYLGKNDINCDLPPLYQEDLELLHMKQYDPLQFIRRVNIETCSILKEKSGLEFASFFKDLSPIFGTEYHIHQGYFRLIRDISSRSCVLANHTSNKLLKMFRETLSVNHEDEIPLRYFQARRVYAYAKEHGYFRQEKKKKVTMHQVPQSMGKIEKKTNKGTMMTLDAFLDFYIEKYKNERIRLDEVFEEYNEINKNKVMSYREY